MFYSCASRLHSRGAVVGSIKKALLAPSPTACKKIQVATLKATYGDKYPYAKPYPYKERPVNTLVSAYEKTIHRLNENSKIIIVEGNLGVGKRDFAKRLSLGFDLHYVEPVPEIDCFTTNPYRFDIRSLNDMLPESARTYDLKDFYHDPHPEKGKVGKLILLWYRHKFESYCQAMKHLLSTGQGVVIPSGVYSELVYVNALVEMGWLNPYFLKYYKDYRAQTICELYRPHLTIYLDAPVDVLKKRIASRKDPREVGARNLTDKYLEKVGEVFKRDFLPFCRKYGEVVELDWSEVATDKDMEAIVEELQFLKLEAEDKDDIKFKDWNRNDEYDFMKLRLFLDDEIKKEGLFTAPLPLDCPELLLKADDYEVANRIFGSHPALSRPPGYAPELGDKVMFKV